LRLVYRTNADNHGPRLYRCLTCDVMTLAGNGDAGRWRVKQRPPFNVWSSCSAVVNGIAYFLIDKRGRDFIEYTADTKPDDIASFDMAAEEWRSAAIQGPVSLHLAGGTKTYKGSIRLAGLNGSLVTVLCNDQDCPSMDLWFLEGVDSCVWTKRYSMRCTSRLGNVHIGLSAYPVVVLDDEKVVVRDKGALKMYDTGTRTWEHLASIEGGFSVRMHQGSLLQTKSSE
ncbi:hypothetical protein BAE44_0015399, partial [Dichanthelium oligosanthes]